MNLSSSVSYAPVAFHAWTSERGSRVDSPSKRSDFDEHIFSFRTYAQADWIDERQENERRGRRGLEGGNDLVVDRQRLTHLDLS